MAYQKPPEWKAPPSRLTVILRNDAPMIHCGDSPSYRSVTLDLTPEQVNRLLCRYVGSSGGVDLYEEVSKCFLEDPTP